jgi:hypothetical protein
MLQLPLPAQPLICVRIRLTLQYFYGIYLRSCLLAVFLQRRMGPIDSVADVLSRMVSVLA